MEWTIRLEAKTGWGEVETVEVVSIARPVLAATADDVGLSLAEAKSLLTRLQEAMVRRQVAEYLHCRRVCPDCLTFQPVKDRRQRRLQTCLVPSMSRRRDIESAVVTCLLALMRRLSRRSAHCSQAVAHLNSSAFRRRSERGRRAAAPEPSCVEFDPKLWPVSSKASQPVHGWWSPTLRGSRPIARTRPQAHRLRFRAV
jgi:hypothetical protein